MKSKELGFTFIEMLVVAAIIAVTAAIALPSFRNMINDNAISMSVNELVSALTYARNEAAKRGTRVVLCRSANPSATNPTCGGTEKNWTTGWLIYSVGDDRATPLYDTSKADVLLATGQPISSNIIIKTNSSANKNFEYNPDGSTNEGGGTGSFAFCDDRGKDFGKVVTILPVGRPKVSYATTCAP